MSPRPKFTGVCRFCGCGAAEDESKACTTPTGDPCHWHDYQRTTCSNPPCVRAWETWYKNFKDERKEKNRKRTPAEIHALILQERKDRRKKKSGAA